MAQCPSCGATLSERLVRQIMNPGSDESCPKDMIRRRIQKKIKEMEKK
jgi:hypothetical protein